MEEWMMGDDESSVVVVRTSSEASNRGKIRTFESLGEHGLPDSINENHSPELQDLVTEFERNCSQEDSNSVIIEDTSAEESAAIRETVDEEEPDGETVTRRPFREGGIIGEALKDITSSDCLPVGHEKSGIVVKVVKSFLYVAFWNDQSFAEDIGLVSKRLVKKGFDQEDVGKRITVDVLKLHDPIVADGLTCSWTACQFLNLVDSIEDPTFTTANPFSGYPDRCFEKDFCLRVTYAISPHEFYGIEENDRIFFEDMSKYISKSCRLREKIPKIVKLNGIYGYFFKSDSGGFWLRAWIKKIIPLLKERTGSRLAVVDFIDYGLGQQVVNEESLVMLPEPFSRLPTPVKRYFMLRCLDSRPSNAKGNLSERSWLHGKILKGKASFDRYDVVATVCSDNFKMTVATKDSVGVEHGEIADFLANSDDEQPDSCLNRSDDSMEEEKVQSFSKATK